MNLFSVSAVDLISQLFNNIFVIFYYRYMINGFNRLPSLDMFDLLIQNSKGELANEVLSERFPEYNGKVCNLAILIFWIFFQSNFLKVMVKVFIYLNFCI